MNNSQMESSIKNLSPLIGNTPLLEIQLEFEGQKRILFAKAENLNMTGSIKDRMAFNILKSAIEKGSRKPNSLIIEATSGNTGIAFAAIGKALGHRISIFMPNWLSQERINLIKSFGAEIILVSKEEGGFLGSIKKAEELAARTENSFLPRQFANQDNCESHYKTTGMEIFWQMKFHGLIPDAFIAGVGTGGTIMGTGKYLREKYPEIKIYPLEPSNSPTLSTGCKVGHHRIQGISDEFIPPILDLNSLDSVVSVDDGDSIIMAQMLASHLGLGVGISSGANLIGALKVQNELHKEAIVVTVFPDDNKKYLSTDLFHNEPVKSDYYSPRIKLTGVKAYKRVCQTCLDTSDCEDCISEIKQEICMKNFKKG